MIKTSTHAYPSEQSAARAAGLFSALGLITLMVSQYSTAFRLIVPGKAAETARNILEHATAFQLGIAFEVIYAASALALAVALYIVFRRRNPGLALTAALCRLVYAIMWVIIAFTSAGAARLLGDDTAAGFFAADHLHALVRVFLGKTFDAYYIGLPFWALASTICSVLWLRSRTIPRSLAVFGVLASAGCCAVALVFIIFPGLNQHLVNWFDVPLAAFEIVIGFWLLFKGLRLPATKNGEVHRQV